MNRFDAYEVHPCVGLDEDGEVLPPDAPLSVFTQCEEDDPNIAVWAVYGHQSGEGLTWIADCADRETAEALRGLLASAKEGKQ